jgi:hypothetical protein
MLYSNGIYPTARDLTFYFSVYFEGSPPSRRTLLGFSVLVGSSEVQEHAQVVLLHKNPLIQVP